jgi:hypothetical protein
MSAWIPRGESPRELTSGEAQLGVALGCAVGDEAV